MTIELPESTITVPTAVTCLTRSGAAGTQISQRLVCYQGFDPSLAPPPPPPPFEEVEHAEVVSTLDAATGLLSGAFLPCEEIWPTVLAAEVDSSIQLDKNGGPGSGSVAVTVDETAPFNCADGEQATGPLTLTPLAQSHDEDRDGCSDWEELGTAQGSGGLRDPFNFWDFMDVPTGSNFIRDKLVDIADINAVVARFGQNDVNGTAPINRNSDPVTTPVPPAGLPSPQSYHPAFDRGLSVGPNNWNKDAADGVIDISDINAAVNQFGHSCVAAP